MILVVAWDGADLSLVEPWIAAGDLPHLASLMERGATRALQSTRPPVTFPAWTTFLTAATPDRHGLSDFTLRTGYRVRFTNAADRRLPTVFSLMSAAGLRVGTYGVPATYPPEPLSGFQIPGFDTPFGASPAAAHGHPSALVERLIATHGSLAIEGPSQARVEEGWHREARARLISLVAQRTEIFLELLREGQLDCAMIHFIESDTVSHQFRQLCDPCSPRYRRSDLAGAMLDVYRALDDALGRLLATLDGDDTVILLSDHGSAATSDRAIFWNRWLAETGRLSFAGRGASARVAAAIKQAAVRCLPSGLHARVFSSWPGAAGRMESAARFAGIDWAQTRVFSEELAYQPSFWVNMRGREPNGVVAPADVPSVLEELSRDLLLLRDPFDGRRVVRALWRRADLYDGRYAQRLPDLTVDLDQPEGCTYAGASSRGGRERDVFRRLRAAEMTGARGTSMPGSHSFHGLCVVTGPGVRPGRYPTSGLEHAGATLLAMAGVGRVPEMNGRAWEDCCASGAQADEALAQHAQGSAIPSPLPYSAAEDTLVAARLRALGYID